MDDKEKRHINHVATKCDEGTPLAENEKAQNRLLATTQPFRAGLLNWRRARHLWHLEAVQVARDVGLAKKKIKKKVVKKNDAT